MYGVKHPFEQFRFLTVLYDVALAWRLVGDREPDADIPVVLVAEEWLLRVEVTGEGEGTTVNTTGLISVNENHALSEEVDISIPLLVVRLPLADPNDRRRLGGHQVLIIDGWHRVYRAWKTGVLCLPGILLTTREEEQVRLSGGYRKPARVGGRQRCGMASDVPAIAAVSRKGGVQ